MTEKKWQDLLEMIGMGRRTPFLGAGVHGSFVRGGAELAKDLATANHYPFRRRSELSEVTQFMETNSTPLLTKHRALQLLTPNPPPDFTPGGRCIECLRVLAAMPFPFYITTNYDNLIKEAIEVVAPLKRPVRDYCRWNDSKRVDLHEVPAATHNPTVREPLIFHLHGIDDQPDSLVLTENDYIGFSRNVSETIDYIPLKIRDVLRNHSLLFIGYGFRDFNYRVLHSIYVDGGNQRNFGITVKRLPAGDPVSPGKDSEAQQYFTDYFRRMNIEVFWGDADSFATELADRWGKYRARP